MQITNDIRPITYYMMAIFDSKQNLEEVLLQKLLGK